MVRPLTSSALKLSLLFAAAISSHAAVITFTDQASFDAAVNGAPVTVESFESTPTGNPLVYPTVSIGCVGPLCGNMQAFPGISTDGTQSVLTYGQDTITFTFNGPINAFAVDILDLGTVGAANLTAVVNGQSVDLFTNYAGGGTLFAGLIDSDGFTSLTLTGSVSGDAIFYDRMQVATTTPEPTTAWLVFGGLSLLGVGRKLKSRRS